MASFGQDGSKFVASFVLPWADGKHITILSSSIPSSIARVTFICTGSAQIQAIYTGHGKEEAHRLGCCPRSHGKQITHLFFLTIGLSKNRALQFSSNM
ncbi:unnamed protein product [Fusarium fujikuroi]|uniref:Uncharacterized protein n=1 Tax=Fusarium fujikuroi TaxID=5127 RepID=A0A9Q9U648_FUSFU|nr:unnamed protein product [Fusarium fujikuroi]VTT83888.1 unnamed protein product [Fusarium fujikuroi]VZI13412.1 unnamed protein product [Fusarium fujikuroi]